MPKKRKTPKEKVKELTKDLTNAKRREAVKLKTLTEAQIAVEESKPGLPFPDKEKLADKLCKAQWHYQAVSREVRALSKLLETAQNRLCRDLSNKLGVNKVRRPKSSNTF